jgi:TolB-like protein
LIDGQVRRDGQAIAVTLELLDGATSAILWTHARLGCGSIPA